VATMRDEHREGIARLAARASPRYFFGRPPRKSAIAATTAGWSGNGSV
jgi:hypothetical protein